MSLFNSDGPSRPPAGTPPADPLGEVSAEVAADAATNAPDGSGVPDGWPGTLAPDDPLALFEAEGTNLDRSAAAPDEQAPPPQPLRLPGPPAITWFDLSNLDNPEETTPPVDLLTASLPGAPESASSAGPAPAPPASQAAAVTAADETAWYAEDEDMGADPTPDLAPPHPVTTAAPAPRNSPAARPVEAPPPVAPAPPPTPAPAVSGAPLALDALLLQRTPVLWREAVAVVEAACAKLIRPEGPDRTAPDLSGIRIHADGSVDVREGLVGEPSVVRLARTLHALSPTRGTPAPLRLLITKWIGSSGGHTILEFATDLSYFGHPDGAALVRALYARATGAPAVEETPVVAIAEPPRARVAVRVPPRAHWHGSREWLMPVAAALSIIITAGIFWLVTDPPSRSVPRVPSRPALSQPARSVPGIAPSSVRISGEPDTPASTARPLAESAPTPPAPQPLPTPGLSPSSGPAASPAPAAFTVQPTAQPPRETRDAPVVPAAEARAEPPGVAGRPAGRPAAPPADPAGASAVGPAVAPPPRETTALIVPRPALPALSPVACAPPPSRSRSVPQSTVYTMANHDVQPPTLVYPQLPPPPTSGPDTAINTMEVVVGPDGCVEQVRLVSTPVRMNDMMLLSAAKNWIFEPALRAGEPVRFRMQVSWATTP